LNPEADARRHADKDEEKFVAPVEKARLDAAEIERIQKERDELLQTMARLRQEHADVHQWINDLLGEVEKERESNIEAESMSARLAVQVGQHRARIQTLEAEVVEQREEAHKLQEQVNGETLVCLVSFLPRIHRWCPDAVGVQFEQVSMTSSRRRCSRATA
jgi:predicted  nucleic acid-binding Zn-ribbon protein